jgi:pSer/pThr/pTyr-binding forkhead associated (FHA) protein
MGGVEYPLRFGRHAIGRSPDADIRILFDGVSPRHAEIDLRPEGAFLSNLVSPSDTQVNGHPAHTIRLHPGDQIRIGPVLLEYRELNTERPRLASRGWRFLIPVLIAGAIVWLTVRLI